MYSMASSGVPMTAVRYFNVFGPRQDPNSDYAAVINSRHYERVAGYIDEARAAGVRV